MSIIDRIKNLRRFVPKVQLHVVTPEPVTTLLPHPLEMRGCTFYRLDDKHCAMVVHVDGHVSFGEKALGTGSYKYEWGEEEGPIQLGAAIFVMERFGFDRKRLKRVDLCDMDKRDTQEQTP